MTRYIENKKMAMGIQLILNVLKVSKLNLFGLLFRVAIFFGKSGLSYIAIQNSL